MNIKEKMEMIKDMYSKMKHENFDDISDLALDICNEFVENGYLTQEYLPSDKETNNVYEGYALYCINDIRFDYNGLDEEMNDFSYIDLAISLALKSI